VDVLRADLHLVIARPEINLAEVLGLPQLIHQIINPGQWVLVLDGHRVQGAVIDTQTLRPILLWNE
jgi:hypothetical protein